MEPLHKSSMLLVLVFISSLLRAQPLEELLAAADSNNLELKALYQDYLAALQRAPQVSQLPEPEAGLGVFVLPVETRLGAQWVRLSATQMFPWKGTLEARSDLVLVMASAQFERIAASRLELHFKVKQAWFQLYLLEHKQRLIRQSLDLYKRIESIALANVEAGKARMADVLRIQVRMRDLESDMAQLEAQKRKPVAVINGLLDRPAETPVVPADTLVPIEPGWNLDSLQRLIAEGHPMLRMFKLQQEAARKAIEVNDLEGKPSFGVGLDYIFVARRTDADPPHNGRDILSPRVAVRLPIYRDKYRAKEQEERIRIDALELRKQDLQLQFRSALEQAFASWDEARIRQAQFAAQHATTRSILDLLLASYSAEGSSFIDLLQTENQLLQYQVMELEAVVQMYLRKSEIERFIPVGQ